MTAKGFRRLFLYKGDLRWHESGFSDVRASFFAGQPQLTTSFLTIAVMPNSVSGKGKPVKEKPQWLTLDSAERLIQKYEEINGPDTYYIIEDDVEPMRNSNGDIKTKTCSVGDDSNERIF